MTALSRYQRLEASALWRPGAGEQRREVIVSLGDATLTLSDLHDRALAHWSLATLHRLNPRARPARFAPSAAPDEGEEIELDDEEMIAAIEKVRRAVERRRPRRGRLRLWLGLALAGGFGLMAVFWLPDALVRQTAALLPEVAREAIGARLLGRMQEATGPVCDGAPGSAALARLGRRVLGMDGVRLAVLPGGIGTTRHLPGGYIVLDRRLVETYDDPETVAGFLLAEALRARAHDPLVDLLEFAGPVATAKLLTTGRLDDAVLEAWADRLLETAPEPVAPETLLPAFAAAGVRSTPYAQALGPTGETARALIESDPVPLARARPLISDQDWVSLQGTCFE
ncbi:MAG: hypothetical protein D6801_07055 [Alphaproteobacteria bacterium]|nr:MAG: hypothetical protein D6801_07055 [Alphaproteobacteria bacterium]